MHEDDDRDREAVISPEALSLLLASTSIDCLYLESIGLIDDHIDAVYEELCGNETLSLLDLQGNYFSDDVIYTFARILPRNNKLNSLDLSGVVLSEASGQQLAKSMTENSTLKYLELEGTEERYRDEFFVPKGHEDTEWMKALDYQLRLNRAGTAGNRQKVCRSAQFRFGSLGLPVQLCTRKSKVLRRSCPAGPGGIEEEKKGVVR
ncbi:MAG: hypothetical protein HC849_30520, partial [Oscillatoriales cyanobacterium RU_3_3]|nr:hypothetical protein [Oscillatoriales cyanobacterium RU_3_3]